MQRKQEKHLGLICMQAWKGQGAGDEDIDHRWNLLLELNVMSRNQFNMNWIKSGLVASENNLTLLIKKFIFRQALRNNWNETSTKH